MKVKVVIGSSMREYLVVSTELLTRKFHDINGPGGVCAATALVNGDYIRLTDGRDLLVMDRVHVCSEDTLYLLCGER